MNFKNPALFLIIILLTTHSCKKENINPDLQPEPITSLESINASSLKNSLIRVDTLQKVRVLFPVSYNTDTLRHFPVVYFIHGFSGNYATDYDVFDVAFEEMANGNINEFFIVKVNSSGKVGGTFCVNSSATGNWEDHLITEVIEYMDNNFRTIPEKESRGIAGFSMGGFGCLYLGLRHPDIYSLVYAVSPGVMRNEDFNSAFNLWLSEGTWGREFIRAYGAAFSPNPDIGYPYAEIPKFDGSAEDDQIIANWMDGFGNFDKKINEYLTGNDRLKKIALDYGLKDFYSWIPQGCIHLAEMLDTSNISFEDHPNSSGEHKIYYSRIKEYMLPFFSENLSY